MGDEISVVPEKEQLGFLPPVPMTDEALGVVLGKEGIENVYAPDGRPESVQTRAGGHGGDILDFYIETEDAYVKCVYEGGPGGLVWKKCDPWLKDDDDYPMEIIKADLDNYSQL